MSTTPKPTPRHPDFSRRMDELAATGSALLDAIDALRLTADLAASAPEVTA